MGGYAAKARRMFCLNGLPAAQSLSIRRKSAEAAAAQKQRSCSRKRPARAGHRGKLIQVHIPGNGERQQGPALISVCFVTVGGQRHDFKP